MVFIFLALVTLEKLEKPFGGERPKTEFAIFKRRKTGL